MTVASSGQMYSPLTGSKVQIGGVRVASLVEVLNSGAAMAAARRVVAMVMDFMLAMVGFVKVKVIAERAKGGSGGFIYERSW